VTGRISDRVRRRNKETDSPFLQERGEGIGPIWSNKYPPTPLQLERGARNFPFDFTLEGAVGDWVTE